MEDVIKLFLMILFTWLIAEIFKVLTVSINTKKFQPNVLLYYGGFPSSHTTLVTSLAVSIFLIEGFNTAFILSLVIFGLTIRDIITLREHIDLNSKSIYVLSNKKIKIKEISHKVAEIIGGLILGVILPILFYLIF